MGRSLRIGSLAGIGIYVHWTFLLLALIVFISGASAGYGTFLTGLLLSVFGCVLLHEMGHALTARRFGIATRDITLTMVGGIARLSRMSERPIEEFWIAIAGPAVNVMIAAVLAGALLVSGLGNFYASYDLATVRNFVQLLLRANVVLVAFNLLPAFPMDGGRVLRALLTGRFGIVRATEIAAGLGVVLAGGLVLVGLLSMVPASPVASPLLPVVGLFVFLMGRQELAAVREREARRTRMVTNVLPAALGLPPDIDFSGFTRDPETHLWIQWHDGRPIQSFLLDAD